MHSYAVSFLCGVIPMPCHSYAMSFLCHVIPMPCRSYAMSFLCRVVSFLCHVIPMPCHSYAVSFLLSFNPTLLTGFTALFIKAQKAIQKIYTVYSDVEFSFLFEIRKWLHIHNDC